MSLSERLHAGVKEGFDLAIGLLGVPATHRTASTSLPTPIPFVGFSSISREEESFIQAYGISGKVVTVKLVDLPSMPIKFDSFEVKSERYVIDLVRPIHLNGELIGWKCFCKGK